MHDQDQFSYSLTQFGNAWLEVIAKMDSAADSVRPTTANLVTLYSLESLLLAG
jgi:hypothetical protein